MCYSQGRAVTEVHLFSLQEEIRKSLEKSEDLSTIREVLIRYKTSGGKRDKAYAELKDLQNAINPYHEDRLLEIMDIVSGFCSSHLKVW